METTTVVVTASVNAPPGDAWELIDNWVGLTAPDEVDSFNVRWPGVGNPAAIFSGTMEDEPAISYGRAGVAEATFHLRDDDSVTKVTVTGELAENIALSLSKGMQVIVAGSDTRDGIIATDVGPSLTKATADVHKVERRG